jgi:hypothetical protein
MNESILQGEHVVLRAREPFTLKGRRIAPHGLYAGLFVASRADAVRLVSLKLAKMPAKKKRARLTTSPANVIPLRPALAVMPAAIAAPAPFWRAAAA